MRAFTCLLFATVTAVGVASAAPNGAPARIMTLGSWRVHDPDQPVGGAQRWNPPDVAGFLALYPTAYLDLGYRDGYPPGNRYWRDKGDQVDEVQRLAQQQGIPDALGRICVTERPDMFSKLVREAGCDPSQGGGGCAWEGDMDGEFGEAEDVVTHSGVASGGGANGLEDDAARWEPQAFRSRLLVLRPGRAGEERRRIVASGSDTLTVDAAWARRPAAGDAYEIRGSFDPRWIQQVPRAVHEAAVRDLWSARRNLCGDPSSPRACSSPAQPLDPLDRANRRAWPDWLDRGTIEALATASTVPALYGPVQDGRRAPDDPGPPWSDPYFSVSAVVMDVTDPTYRAWRLKYLMYKLRDYGLAPGEPACVVLTYKPGWYAHYDEAARGPSGEVCAVPGSGLWTGPAHVCPDGSAPGGPLVSGLYGPGEFERAINTYIRDMIATLAENGWGQLRIILNERPTFTNSKWAILDEDVRRHPAVIGEWEAPIEPKLSALRERPRAGGSPPAIPPDAPEGPNAPTPEDAGGAAAQAPAQAPASETPARRGLSVRSSGSGGGGVIEAPGER